MTWTKLDDMFWMHPKVVAVGNVGAGIYTRLLVYSGCYNTDGLVPSHVVSVIVADDGKALERLESVGLVQRLETGAVLIPDYLEYNRSKAQVEADRETRRANGRLGGRPPRKRIETGAGS